MSRHQRTGTGAIRSPFAVAVVLVAGATVVGGCLPAPATQQAHAVTDLWTVFIVAAAGVGALVWGLI
ncbi:MAG TPA: hypothetical protein VIM24_01570, partial [Candidatus Limnocylindrales bacterium]